MVRFIYVDRPGPGAPLTNSCQLYRVEGIPANCVIGYVIGEIAVTEGVGSEYRYLRMS